MLKTKRGLPNTCSQCGKPVQVKEGWFAANDDEARSGLGVCAKCVDKPKPEPKPEAKVPAGNQENGAVKEIGKGGKDQEPED